jgi:hypothetical protein
VEETRGREYAPSWRTIIGIACEVVTAAGISATVKRRPCCKALNRGYAAAFGRWCGSSGSADEPGSANSANEACTRSWRAEPPVARMGRGGSRIHSPCTLLCPMPILPSSDFHLWSPSLRYNPPNRRMRTRMYGGVAQWEGRPSPLCRSAAFAARPEFPVKLRRWRKFSFDSALQNAPNVWGEFWGSR